jgi:membrane associated rhomboid family serine protease
MKTFLKEIPLITKSIIGISVTFFLINFIFNLFGINLNDYLCLYQFKSDDFKIYQILSFSFCHSIDPTHLIYNSIFLLFFSIQCEILLKKHFYKLILFTIFLAVIGLQIFDLSGGSHIGLSIIGLSTITYFVLSKNKLDSVLSFPLKMFGVLMIITEVICFIKGYKNNVYDSDFHSSYAHIIGVLSGSIFYLYMKIKKGA